jgi:ZIP family zinc transporter
MFIASSLASQMSWFLSFGAGAMLYVTIDELLPEAHQQGLEHFGLWSFMGGFAVMMLMETLI